MHILYGIQGTGNGHLARARALVPELIAQGHTVDFVFSGRAAEDFFNMEIFGHHYQVFSGLSLVTEKGKLNLWKTLKSNQLIRLVKDIMQLKVKQYDLVLSDFDPVTAWAAKLKKVTSMSISHQAAFQFDIPKAEGHDISRTIMRCFAPTQYSLGLHWHHFNQSILPPLIEPLTAVETVKNQYLVYMGFESLDDILQFLQPFTAYQFHVFANVAEPKRYRHIHVHPLSHTEFHQHLLLCEGVISNAGFELASECLHLGKKLLVKPLLGQFEQLSNAIALEELAKGVVMHDLDQEKLKHWLTLPAIEASHYPQVAKAIVEWLSLGEWHKTDDLVKDLWAQMPAQSQQYKTTYQSPSLQPAG